MSSFFSNGQQLDFSLGTDATSSNSTSQIDNTKYNINNSTISNYFLKNIFGDCSNAFNCITNYQINGIDLGKTYLPYVVIHTSSNTNMSIPVGATYMNVITIGGGGCGGSNKSNQSVFGRGGASGSISVQYIICTTTRIYNVIVGSKGNANVSAPNSYISYNSIDSCISKGGTFGPSATNTNLYPANAQITETNHYNYGYDISGSGGELNMGGKTSMFNNILFASSQTVLKSISLNNYGYGGDGRYDNQHQQGTDGLVIIFFYFTNPFTNVDNGLKFYYKLNSINTVSGNNYLLYDEISQLNLLQIYGSSYSIDTNIKYSISSLHLSNTAYCRKRSSFGYYTNGGMTFSIWVNVVTCTNTNSSGAAIFGFADSTNGGLTNVDYINIYTNSSLYYIAANSTKNLANIQLVSTTTILLNTWNHICWTISSSGKWTLYINNNPATLQGGYPDTTLDRIYADLGTRASIGGLDNAYYDEYRYYTKCLTPIEVTTLYAYNPSS